MVRIHNPNKNGNNKKLGADDQLHGGMMENVDQVSNAVAKAVRNVGDKDKNNQ
ncbi:hypothetical protein [Bacillus sp. T33-2]|uniref:hypothetical protein n=1 Tax=Bacillus sp. T33-2 TaxID=2054168 RepID=UPI0015E07964|nr:hypothetical protein [Bacillus sp. T33-2]